MPLSLPSASAYRGCCSLLQRATLGLKRKRHLQKLSRAFHMAKDARGEDTLKIVDKVYIITTPTGEEIQLKLTRETRAPTRANPGDRVEAKISEQGQTLSVKLIKE